MSTAGLRAPTSTTVVYSADCLLSAIITSSLRRSWDVSYTPVVLWVETIRAEGYRPPGGANVCDDGMADIILIC